MATTSLKDCLRLVSEALEGFYESKVTVGATTTPTDDNLDGLTAAQANFFSRWWILPTAGQNFGVERLINTSGTGAGATLAPFVAYTSNFASGDAYQLHWLRPRDIVEELNRAIRSVFPWLYRETEAIGSELTDQYQKRYSIPSAIIGRPWKVEIEETPLAWDNDEVNLLDNASFEEGTGTPTSWTLTGAGAGATRVRWPRRSGSYATNIAVPNLTTVELQQTHSDRNYWSPGMRLMAWAWIYSRTASRITVKVFDDVDTTGQSSSAHGGGGWERLALTTPHTVGEGATTLTFQIAVTSGNRFDFTVGEAFLARGENVVESVWSPVDWKWRGKDIELWSNPNSLRALRFHGKNYLTQFTLPNGNPAFTLTETVELGEPEIELLIAETVLRLYRRFGQRTVPNGIPEADKWRQVWEARRAEALRIYSMPQKGIVTPAYAGR